MPLTAKTSCASRSAQKTTALFNIIRAQANEIHKLRNELIRLQMRAEAGACAAAEVAPAAVADFDTLCAAPPVLQS